MNVVGIVISRYYEDLRWVEQLKAPLDVYIYNRRGPIRNLGVRKDYIKDINDIGNLNVEIVKRNKVNLEIIDMEDDPGYEASTYMHHLYTRYNSLNPFTVCLQAHPAFYCKDITSRLNNLQKLIYTKYIPYPFYEGLKPAEIQITDSCIEFEFVTDMYGWLIPASDYGWSPYRQNVSKAPFWQFCRGIPGWSENRVELPEPFSFGTGVQFVVSKERVLKHEPGYYKRIQDFVNTYVDPNPVTPITLARYYGPSIMEGIYQFIF